MSPTQRLGLLVIVPVLVLIVLQAVPYGRDHSNPPDGVVAAFDSPETEALAQRACFDCHSNRTRWPWYASVAPISWRIQSHVQEGREALNFTAFAAGSEKMAEAAGEAGETITKGEMPPRDYLLLHPEARLSAAEQAALVRGLNRTLASWSGEARGEGGREGRSARAAKRGERAGHGGHDAEDD